MPWKESNVTTERMKFFLSSVFGGQPIGLNEVDDDLWLVSFMDYDLGYYDLKEREFAVIDTAFLT
ncbi:MAG: hypothetical protein ISR65_06900 [Bacteriovoracaceae bacterium]|nr:hypothetical protein [Bacteriovoracaceae bacterium]